jgi:hypothetical protein
MLKCDKCGAENPLGRVFCVGCGAKLDLSGVTRGEIAKGRKLRTTLRQWPIAIGAVVVLLLVCVGMALWPNMEPVGEKGTPGGASRVSARLTTMGRLQKDRTVVFTFAEKDINGFLEYRKIGKMKVQSLSVDVGEGYLRVRVVRRLKAIGFGPVQFNPTISQELLCTPSGSMLRIRRAWFGHLRLWGPVRTTVSRSLYKMFSRQREWKAFQHITDIAAEDEKVVVKVKR